MKNVARAGGSEPGPPAEARPRSCGGAPPRPRPTRGHEALTQKARKFNARKFGPNLGSSGKTDLETRGKHKELNRKLRAPTRRKARAREEPSPGPPASETDARPPGHQPRGGAPARPRFSRGQEGPTSKARKFSAVQNFAILAPNLDLNNETDLEACGTRAELKRKS